MEVEADPVGVQKRTVILTGLIRPLKWGTVRLWTPTGLAATAVKVERSKKTFVLGVKQRFFSNVQLWRLVSLHPVGVQRRTVPHFNRLKTVKMRNSMSLYSYWIGLHIHFKKAILHLKRATVRFYLSICVYRYIRTWEVWTRFNHMTM